MQTFSRPAVGAGVKTLPAQWYRSSDIFSDERERVFGAQWVCVGRTERIENPGDFFTISLAGESLIVTRDRDGDVRALYNVCRHRGTRLCERTTGRFQGSIQCSYHAWTYGLDGTLKAARNMAEVPGFDLRDYSLKQAAVALWEGFIFINLEPDPQPLHSALPALDDRFDPWNIERLRTVSTIDYDIACNWKLVFQNYSECYHCPLVHPQLDKLSPSDSGRNNLSDGPVLGGYSELRTHGGSLTTSGHTNRPPLGSVHGPDLDRIYYYTIFPSVLLSLHPDYVMVHYVEPISPQRTKVSCTWLFDPDTSAACDFDPHDAVEFWDLTNRQDWHVSELTQLGVSSRAYVPGPYSNAEGLLAAFDRHYLRVMGAA